MVPGIRMAWCALLAAVLITPALAAAASDSVDIDKALDGMLPALGLEPHSSGARNRLQRGTPQPRVCGRKARQIVHYTELAARAGEIGDRALEERMAQQVRLLEQRAATKCPDLDLLIDVAADPEAIAGSHICTRYAFQIAHFEEMADRADTFGGSPERRALWRERNLAHSKMLRETAVPVCPKLEDDAVAQAREFAKLMKFAAKTALRFFTFGAYPF